MSTSTPTQEAVVTAVAPQPIATRPNPTRTTVKGSRLLHMLSTTDPKDIGVLYLVTPGPDEIAARAVAGDQSSGNDPREK